MFKIKWAPKCNGVILSEYIEEDEMLHNPSDMDACGFLPCRAKNPLANPNTLRY